MIRHKLKINVFGEALTIHSIPLKEIENLQIAKVLSVMKTSLIDSITDPYFYYLLKNEKIKYIEDLGSTKFFGLLNSPKNHIEIWYKNKKVQKLTLSHLDDRNLLFPLFNSCISDLELNFEDEIIINQKEIGLIGQYEYFVADFNIMDLKFVLNKFEDNVFLSQIKFLDTDLQSVKKDTILTYINASMS